MDSYNQFRVAIGESVLKKYRIYLDTRYWIFMRDAFLGKATPTQIRIYKKLKAMVATGSAICPLSPDIFIELMKQGNREQRLNSARVMDELSHQVCFISPADIAGQELISFIRFCQEKAKGRPLFEPEKYVWTKVALMKMGDNIPSLPGIPNSQMNSLRAEFIDYLSKFTLVQILEMIKGDLSVPDFRDLAARLNRGKDNNQQWSSFPELYMHEVAGCLDILKDDIEKVWAFLYQADTGRIPTTDEVHQSQCVKYLSNLVYGAFDKKKIGKELPFIRVNSSLHAFLRYNREQRYKENDFFDFSHAAWALPYCNGFFTEKPLQDWICGNLLKLDELYGTKVLSKEEDVLEHLSQALVHA